ncbi:MAG: hypothetical protein A3A47_01410 [Candidatus Levybacteria bacterium RIFCSPLOWO2_01_FULL_37_20]|nr:MAG: hypothetical protein A3A47_01410 [Candidatus Levybacteria bacterium RIFCSPLOWO2_01_FULL_37_20]OGH44848.1 MAG: hypothetical protein A3J14_02430 [Candidatus Levybacteria bacterium RIFCSPLOWO2_02_FULL_37_18]
MTKRQFQQGFIKLTKRALITYLIGFLILSGTGIGFIFLNPKKVSAAWFDDNWAFRKAVTFTHNAAVSTPTQVEFDIDTTGSPTTFQDDCGDVRFTDPNGKILKYYLDSASGPCDDASTDFDVLMPSIINGSNLIYMYYGNPSAANGTQAADFSDATTTPSGGAASAGSEEKATSPVAYWKFDDGTGTTAQDSTTNNNDGTLTNSPTWQTEDMCISGKCLLFDGTDDFVKVNDANSLDLGTGDFTIQLWFRRTGNFGTRQDLINKKDTTSYTNGDYSVYIDTNNDIILYTANVSDSYSGIGANSVNDSNWHQITGVRTGTSILIYLDGKLRQTSTGLTVRNVSNNGKLRIGSNRNDGNENDSNVVFPFKGFVDEPKIYPYARTADQIKADYNSRANNEGSSFNSGGGVIASGAKQSSLSDGLVGYWKMDEASGNRSDSSGNGNTLTDNNTVTANPGKFGNAGQFTSANTETLSIADNSTVSTGDIDFTISAWVYMDTKSTDHVAVGKWNDTGSGYDFAIQYLQSSDRFRFVVFPSGGSQTNLEASSFGSPSTSTWHFIMVWHDSVNNTLNIQVNNGTVDSLAHTTGVRDSGSAFVIGGLNTSQQPWNGRIEEVRFYKKVLSAAERTSLYNFAPGPVGYWKMDEKTGTSANDSSGNANTGTITGATWKPGKFGASLDYDGTDDVNTITNASAIDLNTNSAYTFEAWVYADSAGEGSGGQIYQKGATTFLRVDTLSGANLDVEAQLDLATTDATLNISAPITTNTWHHIAVTYEDDSDDEITIYIDGVNRGSSTDGSGAPAADTNNLLIGGTTTDNFDGKIDDFKMYAYARTQKQVIEDMGAGHPGVYAGSSGGSTTGGARGGPVAYWKFDEGADNRCSGGTNDVCNSGSNGTTLDGTSTASRSLSGKFDKALDFDGSDDVVTITNSSAIDLNTTSAYTFSAWVNTDTDGEGDVGQIFQKGTTTYLRVDSQSGSNLDVQASFDLATTDATLNISAPITTASWNHILLVYEDDSDDEISIYINGILRGTSTDGSGAPAADTNNLLIGGTTTANFDGKIDEFKVYSYPLTADEVKLEYNRGSNLVLGALSDNSTYQPNAANQEYCIPGDSTTCTAPVGRWDFEEKSGSSVIDTSGNGYTGTWNGTGTPHWKPGKHGSAGNFNGTDDFVSITPTTLLGSAFTIESWIKISSTSIQTFFSQGLTDFFVEGVLKLQTNSNGTKTIISANAPPLNVWVHVAVTKSGTGAGATKLYINGVQDDNGTATDAPNTGTTRIGNESANGRFVNGQIDEVRVYNYARSAAQVAWDYNRGAPVAYYKMDECQGTVINDSSGNSNTGTLTVGSGGSETTIGNCPTSSTAWGNGVTGKRNYSLNFDGTDDYVSMANASILNPGNNTSYGAWFRTTNATTYQQILNKQHSAGNVSPHWGVVYRLYVNTNNLVCQVFNGSAHVTATATGVISSNNTWYHGLCTLDGSTLKVFLDGKQVASASFSGTVPTSDTGNLLIGARTITTTSYMSGQIDDARIYNYALTATQIKLLMNDGAVRFGPNTGAP